MAASRAGLMAVLLEANLAASKERSKADWMEDWWAGMMVVHLAENNGCMVGCILG